MERICYRAPTEEEIEKIITLHNNRLSDFEIGKELNLTTKTVTREINKYYLRRNQQRLYYRGGKKLTYLNDKDKDFIRKKLNDDPKITHLDLKKALKDALGTDASEPNIRRARKEISESTRTYNPQPSTSASQLIQHVPLGGTSAQGVPWQSEQNLYQVPVERTYNPQPSTSASQLIQHVPLGGTSAQGVPWQSEQNLYQVPVERTYNPQPGTSTSQIQNFPLDGTSAQGSVPWQSEQNLYQVPVERTYNPQPGTSTSQIQNFPLGGTSAQGSVPWQSEQNLYQVPVERTYNPQPGTSASQIQNFPLGGTSAQGSVPWQSEQNLYQVPVERTYNPQPGTSASQIQNFPLGGTSAQGSVPWQSEQNLYQVPVERSQAVHSQAVTSKEHISGSEEDILDLYDKKLLCGYYDVPQFSQEINQLKSKLSGSVLKESEKSKKDNSAKEESKEGVSSESPQSDKALSEALSEVLDNEELLVDPDNARAGPSGSHEDIVKTIEEYLKKDDQQGASRSDVHEPDNESEKNEESKKQEKSLKRKRQDSE